MRRAVRCARARSVETTVGQHMTTNNRTTATQAINARTAKDFIEQLTQQAKTLRNRHMAYLGLWGQGAVLDTIGGLGNLDRLEALKVGEKLELAASPETHACNPTFIKSIHLVGDQIVCNGDQNLFT